MKKNIIIIVVCIVFFTACLKKKNEDSEKKVMEEKITSIEKYLKEIKNPSILKICPQSADANYYDNVRHGVERTLDKLGIDYEYEDTEDENYPFGIKKITIYDAEFRTTEKELKPLKKGANNK